MGQSEIISALTGTLAHKAGDQSIGAILIDAGRLSLEDAERILRLQRQKGLRFGEAAMQLHILSRADIDFALSRQFHYPYLTRGETAVSEDVVAAYEPFSRQAESLRALRSQLMLRWFDGDPARKSLVVVSAARKEGRSFIVANLAVVFAQLGERTLLIDADLRNSCQHRLFGLENGVGLSAVLAGRAGAETIQRNAALPKLSVLCAGAPPPNPQELLAGPLFQQLLLQLAEQVDVILLDSPAASETADAQILAVRAGATMIVARRNATRMWRVQGVSDSVVQARSTIVGTVLNDF
ncbi:MAG TPA: chain length determinant protein tyrosine kinase EpsG [Burkholderiales bacterium]|nr:chain length determinant protein tyrosine kinase EpsG [Burkholderiales bacterium]